MNDRIVTENINFIQFSDPKNDEINDEIFVKKLYLILSIQYLIILFFCFLTVLSDNFSNFQKENKLYMSLFIFILFLLMSLIFTSIFNKDPINIALFFFFTITQSYIISSLCNILNANLILMLTFMTFCLFFSLFLLSISIKFDFDIIFGLYYLLYVIGMLFTVLMIYSGNETIHIIISSLWILIFGVYVLYDTKLMLKNKDTNDSFIYASFLIYTDIFLISYSLIVIIPSVLFGNENDDTNKIIVIAK